MTRAGMMREMSWQQWCSQEFDWEGGVYVLTSHCNFRTCPTREQNGYWFFGGGYISIYPRRYAPGWQVDEEVNQDMNEADGINLEVDSKDEVMHI